MNTRSMRGIEFTFERKTLQALSQDPLQRGSRPWVRTHPPATTWRAGSQCAVEWLASVAERHIVDQSFDPQYGARPLKRAIQQRIENPLSKLLLEGVFLPKDVIHVVVDPVRAPGEFSFQK